MAHALRTWRPELRCLLLLWKTGMAAQSTDLGKPSQDYPWGWMASQSKRIGEVQIQWETASQTLVGRDWERHLTLASGFYIQTHTCEQTHTWAHTHIYIWVHTKTCTYTCTCMKIDISLCCQPKIYNWEPKVPNYPPFVPDIAQDIGLI